MMMKRKRIWAGLMVGWLAGAGALQADVLLGWHTPDVNGTNPVNDATPDTAATGVSGSLSGGRDVETNDGSTDGSYGTIPIPGSPATANRIRVRTNGGDNVITLSISNNTGSDLQLDRLVFDYGRFTNGPTTATVVYVSGDLTDGDGTPIGNPIGLADSGGVNGDFPDYAADLAAALGDSILADTESATFRLTFSDAASGSNAGALDNIAILGSAAGAPSGTAPRVAFDDHATGAATDASLDAVTTAGAWTLNTARSAATYTVKNDAGDKALELDDVGSDNAGEQVFATLTFPAALSFSTEPVGFAFNTAARRDAGERGYLFVFKDAGGNEAGRLEWASDIGGATDGVYLNGTAGTPGSGASLGTVAMGGSLNPWVATDRLLSVTFSNAQIHVDFAGVTGSAAVLNGATDLKSMTVLSNGSNPGNRGLYLDDINAPSPPPVEVGPAPHWCGTRVRSCRMPPPTGWTQRSRSTGRAVSAAPTGRPTGPTGSTTPTPR